MQEDIQALADQQGTFSTQPFSELATARNTSNLSQQQVNFLRFATLLIDDVSASLRELFVRLWDEAYADRPWGTPNNQASGIICWDGSELDVDSGIQVEQMNGTNVKSSAQLVLIETKFAEKDKVLVGAQSDASIVQRLNAHTDGTKITLNKLKPFGGEATVYTQRIKHETKATKQMARPFAQKVRAGDTSECGTSRCSCSCFATRLMRCSTPRTRKTRSAWII
jgi:hypothetical protein